MAVTTKGISGRLASRAVAFIELPVSLGFVGLYIYLVFFYYWQKLGHCSKCVLEAIVFGLYSVASVVISLLLVLATFSVFKLQKRKWIATVWCTFDMLSFIATVVLICTHEEFEHRTDLFLASVILLLKFSIFFCVVCTYVWGLSELIQDNRNNRMPASPMRMGERRVVSNGFWALRAKKELGKMKISTKL